MTPLEIFLLVFFLILGMLIALCVTKVIISKKQDTFIEEHSSKLLGIRKINQEYKQKFVFYDLCNFQETRYCGNRKQYNSFRYKTVLEEFVRDNYKKMTSLYSKIDAYTEDIKRYNNQISTIPVTDLKDVLLPRYLSKDKFYEKEEKIFKKFIMRPIEKSVSLTIHCHYVTPAGRYHYHDEYTYGHNEIKKILNYSNEGNFIYDVKSFRQAKDSDKKSYKKERKLDSSLLTKDLYKVSEVKNVYKIQKNIELKIDEIKNLLSSSGYKWVYGGIYIKAKYNTFFDYLYSTKNNYGVIFYDKLLSSPWYDIQFSILDSFKPVYRYDDNTYLCYVDELNYNNLTKTDIDNLINIVKDIGKKETYFSFEKLKSYDCLSFIAKPENDRVVYNVLKNIYHLKQVRNINFLYCYGVDNDRYHFLEYLLGYYKVISIDELIEKISLKYKISYSKKQIIYDLEQHQEIGGIEDGFIFKNKNDYYAFKFGFTPEYATVIKQIPNFLKEKAYTIDEIIQICKQFSFFVDDNFVKYFLKQKKYIQFNLSDYYVPENVTTYEQFIKLSADEHGVVTYSNVFKNDEYMKAFNKLEKLGKLVPISNINFLLISNKLNYNGINIKTIYDFHQKIRLLTSEHRYFSVKTIREKIDSIVVSNEYNDEFINALTRSSGFVYEVNKINNLFTSNYKNKREDFILYIMKNRSSISIYDLYAGLKTEFDVDYSAKQIRKDAISCINEGSNLYFNEDTGKIYENKEKFLEELQ